MNTELGLVVKTKAPKIRPEFAESIVALLAKAGDWRTKREIAAELGVAFTPAFERKLRLVAETAAPRVLSWPGSPGLKHWNFGTVEEVDQAIKAHESQGADHYRRANRYRIAYHSKFRAPMPQTAQQGTLL
jgi:hypothetical protein